MTSTAYLKLLSPDVLSDAQDIISKMIWLGLGYTIADLCLRLLQRFTRFASPASEKVAAFFLTRNPANGKRRL